MNSFEEKSGRFFLKLKNDLKPSRSPIGQNTIASYPQKMAEFLQLPEAEKYTSHSFRHSGATILADAGATVMQLQQAGGWESSSVAQSYIEEGATSRLQIAQRFEDTTSSSSITKRSRTAVSTSSSKASDTLSMMPTISISSGSSNNHIHVNIGYPPISITSGSSVTAEEEC